MHNHSMVNSNQMAKSQFKNMEKHTKAMKTGKLLILSGIVLMLLPMFAMLASALTDSDADYLIKQYSVFDLKRPCTYNGSQCSYAATCNITISYAQGNGTQLYNNTLMSNKGAYHNLTLQSIDNLNPGWYQVYITCHDQDDDGSEVFYYRVTPTGDDNNTTTLIIICTAFVLIIAFGYLIKDLYIVFIGGMTALIAGTYGMAYGFGSTSTDFTKMLSLVIISIGIIFTIQSAYNLIESNGETGYEEIIDEER